LALSSSARASLRYRTARALLHLTPTQQNRGPKPCVGSSFPLNRLVRTGSEAPRRFAPRAPDSLSLSMTSAKACHLPPTPITLTCKSGGHTISAHTRAKIMCSSSEPVFVVGCIIAVGPWSSSNSKGPRIVPRPLNCRRRTSGQQLLFPSCPALLEQIVTIPRLSRGTWDLSFHLAERGTSRTFLTASARSIARSASTSLGLCGRLAGRWIVRAE
jgi:hypothetical protein